jgi:hypothetical protein
MLFTTLFVGTGSVVHINSWEPAKRMQEKFAAR